MRVNVVGQSNGVGLSRDLSLLADALRDCGCVVEVTALTQRDAKRRRSRWVQWSTRLQYWYRALRGNTARKRSSFDLVVMMEHVWPEQALVARHSVVMPNPEWFDRHDVRALGLVHQVWAKTANTMNIFQQLGKPVAHVGFDSEDRLDASVAREFLCFHLAGRSTMKGTAQLLDIWSRHPEWPTLVVVQSDASYSAAVHAASNIQLMTGYLQDAQLRALQNRCRVHLCTSETEGWGHYLVEAMSVGALTITLDAPPMNEMVTVSRGWMLPAKWVRQQKLADCFTFMEDDLVAALDDMGNATEARRTAMQTAAREWFVDNKRGFSERLARALQGLLSK